MFLMGNGSNEISNLEISFNLVNLKPPKNHVFFRNTDLKIPNFDTRVAWHIFQCYFVKINRKLSPNFYFFARLDDLLSKPCLWSFLFVRAF